MLLWTTRSAAFICYDLSDIMLLIFFHNDVLVAKCVRLIKEFDREIKDDESRNPPEVTKELNDVKQNMVSFEISLILENVLDAHELNYLNLLIMTMCSFVFIF